MRRLVLATTLCGCAAAAPTPSPYAPLPPPPPVPAPATPSAVVLVAPPDVEPAPPHCPEEMALITRFQGAYCVDRWEASLERGETGKSVPWPGNRPVDGVEAELFAVSVLGRKPQGYISGAQAAAACAHAGKRLCEMDEWVRACKGPRITRYPYGDERRPNLCNDRFKVLDHHPVVSLWMKDAPAGADPKLMWHPGFMNDPRLHEFPHSVRPSGAFPACTNEYGVFDMVGNLHEWVADPDGTFVGGFFMDTFQNGQGCEYRTVAHEYEYHDYSTGFRCCADART
jgi:formylglycine-generating enzyme